MVGLAVASFAIGYGGGLPLEGEDAATDAGDASDDVAYVDATVDSSPQDARR